MYEGVQGTFYDTNGLYKKHYDLILNNTVYKEGQRNWTILIYLNDN